MIRISRFRIIARIQTHLAMHEAERHDIGLRSCNLTPSHPRRPDRRSAFIVPSIQTSDQREEDILYNTRH